MDLEPLKAGASRQTSLGCAVDPGIELGEGGEGGGISKLLKGELSWGAIQQIPLGGLNNLFSWFMYRLKCNGWFEGEGGLTECEGGRDGESLYSQEDILNSLDHLS